ncbi:Beta-xylosidase [Pirellulimonas nuda]|uniref:Beta-xylosidase n=2 Tax=Pirellulimonas nuda TaxID=2528009 RepID=A0A518DAB8_9BACT|nr:Beta-xylosidase [Pirellulimonas nuda]
MYRFWDVYPVTDQSPFLDEQQLSRLKQKYRYARFINCVRLFGGKDSKKDDYFRGVDARGQAICDFSEALAMLSGIRSCGFTPWIVLDNVPAEMSENPTKNLYGNTEPPASFDLWSSYVRQFARALVEEFGVEEVAQWRFRVGTEPDFSPGHWTGTQQQYLKHYDYTVAAVRSVLPSASIGPGNVIAPLRGRKQKSWAPAIINHCATGTNHVSGSTGTPLDVFGSSYYTSVGRSDIQFDAVVEFLREEIGNHPQFDSVPVEIHEFGILSEGGKQIAGDGTEFGSSWLAHMSEKIYRNDVRRVYQWDWNTDKGGNIPTPLTHVMDMLEEMAGGTRLSVESDQMSEMDHIGCIAARNGDVVNLIVFRHLAERSNGNKVLVRLTLDGGSFVEKELSVTRANLLDGEHAGFMAERNADMKHVRAKVADNAKTHAITRKVMAAHRAKYEELSKLHSVDPLPKPTVDSLGRMHFDLMLDGHAVVVLQLR